MTRDRPLHLDCRDVLTARDNDVLGAISQFDVGVRVDDAEITRVEPSSAKGFRRRTRIPKVARQHRVATDEYFANRLAIGRHVAHLVVDDSPAGDSDVQHALACLDPRLIIARINRPQMPG